MNIDTLREYCLSIKEATEDMPFDDPYLVFRVLGKWFAVVPLQDEELKIFVKCDPDKAVDLRDEYDCVEAAWQDLRIRIILINTRDIINVNTMLLLGKSLVIVSLLSFLMINQAIMVSKNAISSLQ